MFKPIPDEAPPIEVFAMLFMLPIPFIIPLIDPAGRLNEDCLGGGGIGRLNPDEGVAEPLPGGGGNENDDPDRFCEPIVGRC